MKPVHPLHDDISLDEEIVIITETQPLLQPLKSSVASDEKGAENDRSPTLFGSPVAYGYLLMALAAVAKASRATLFHIAESVFDFPPSVVLLLSAIIFTVFSFSYIHYAGILRRTPMTTSLLGRLALRGIFAAITLYLDNVALSFIPVGTALTLFSTSPAITSVLAALFLGDAITAIDLAVLVVNMVGVIYVAQPTAKSDPDFLLGVGAALGAALSSSLGFTVVKVMGSRVHFMLNMAAIGLGCFIISVMFTPLPEYAVLFTAFPATLIPLAGSTVGFITQALANRGVQLCRPGPALVVRSFAVPLSFALGFIFLDEKMSLRVVAGVALVLASIAYTGLSQIFRNKK